MHEKQKYAIIRPHSLAEGVFSMDLKRLKYFCKVVEHGSISQAARALNMAQPPLSRRIQELEEELNASLFVRNGNRIEPTDAGNFLYRRASDIFRQIENTTRETIQIANREKRLLRIGLTHLYQFYFKPLFLELYRKHPEIELRISVSDSSNLEEQLNDGLLDLALIQKPYQPECFDYIAFEPVKLVAVINKALAGCMSSDINSGTIPYLAIGELPLVLLQRSRDSGIYEMLFDNFSKGGVNPNVIMHIAQPGVIIDWLESGLKAATLLPESEVDASRLENCFVLDVFPSPQVFFPAMVKTIDMPWLQEFLGLLEQGYPFK